MRHRSIDERVVRSFRDPRPVLILGGVATVIIAVFAMTTTHGRETIGAPVRSALPAPGSAATTTQADTADASPTTVRTRRFRSRIHGYAAAYPGEWLVEPATTTWTPVESDVMQPAGIDHFQPRPNARGIMAASTPLPEGMSIDEWIAQTLPSRQRGDDVRACSRPGGGGTTMGLPPERWVKRPLGRREARERDSCFTIDVVVQVGGRAYLFTGTSERAARTPTELRRPFDEFLASITFDEVAAVAPTPPPTHVPDATPVAFTERWTSPRYGYTARIPDGWTVAPATATAKLDRSMPFPGRFALESMDIISEGLSKRLWVVSMPIAETADLDAWVAVHFPRRQLGETNQCGGRATPVPEAWVPVIFAGRPGRERDICGRIDVVFVGGSRAYVISGRSPTAFSTPLVDRAMLDAFVASIDVHPEAATAEPSVAPYVPRTTYNSTLYGYALDAPWALDVVPGTTAWKPGESWSKRGVADRFERRGGFSIVSTTLPRGVTLDDWIAANVPAPTQTDDACRFGFAMVGVPTGLWQEADIGGHPGRIRDGCEVDAVVAIGQRVYLLSARTLRPDYRISNLKEIARYIDFRPKSATAP
jgi:hypothetical protein